jgi:hypothetical protein
MLISDYKKRTRKAVLVSFVGLEGGFGLEEMMNASWWLLLVVFSSMVKVKVRQNRKVVKVLPRGVGPRNCHDGWL